jgi:hypothetical protein
LSSTVHLFDRLHHVGRRRSPGSDIDRA